MIRMVEIDNFVTIKVWTPDDDVLKSHGFRSLINGEDDSSVLRFRDDASRLALAQAIAGDGYVIAPCKPSAATVEAEAEAAHETYFDYEWSDAGDAERALWRQVVRGFFVRLALPVPTGPTGDDGGEW